MTRTVAIHRRHLVARFDARAAATLDDLTPLVYERASGGLPAHVRAASAVRRFGGRLVIVQDDVDALAVLEVSGAVRPVLLPARVAVTAAVFRRVCAVAEAKTSSLVSIMMFLTTESFTDCLADRKRKPTLAYSKRLGFLEKEWILLESVSPISGGTALI